VQARRFPLTELGVCFIFAYVSKLQVMSFGDYKMSTFQAVCPECKTTQPTSFIASPDERLLSDQEFWTLLNGRDEIRVFHLSNEGDRHDHVWILGTRSRAQALTDTKPQST
jgi:hypothetical protein